MPPSINEPKVFFLQSFKIANKDFNYPTPHYEMLSRFNRVFLRDSIDVIVIFRLFLPPLDK